MNKLEELAQKYGTDKIGKHNYLPFYYDLFKNKRTSVKKVLEMGAGEGASLFMWRDFFTKAKIYSGEIEEGRLFKRGRVEVIKCDQYSEDDLLGLVKRTGTNIDLFVDDGSHIPDHQVFTCLKLMPLLDRGVVYVIEDVSDPYIFSVIKKEYPQAEMIKVGKRYDDRLIICRK